MLVYFSGSARDIRNDIGTYRTIISAVKAEGGIMAQNWTEAAAAVKGFPDDMEWWRSICEDAQEALKDVDRVIVEATGSSTLGVGFELAHALANGKPTLALVKRDTDGAYVKGLRHPLLRVVEYGDEDLVKYIREFVRAGEAV
jgi:uncharacterized protein YukE